MNKQENKISFTDYVKANTDQDQFKIIDDEKNTPTLKEAQDFVGGYVECIGWPNGDLLIVNEEGKLKGLPLNPEATLLWKMTFDNDNYVTGRKDFVVGPAIYIKKHALKDWAYPFECMGATQVSPMRPGF